MKLVLISDTHNLHDQVVVPDGDVLIHAGDFTMGGTMPEISRAMEWFRRQPHKHKICVAGNHDFLFERKPDIAKAFTEGVTYLENSGITIEGKNFYGSPVQPWFMDWAFNVQRGSDIKKYWDKIPDGLDVLITHGPPMGILDVTAPRYGSEHVGCEELLTRVEIAKPKIHVFGHIHGGYGRSKDGATTYYNASVCDEDYKVSNRPWVVEI